MLFAATTFLSISDAQTPEGNAPFAEAQLADDNTALLSRSQALSDAERERARQLFATGFQLWQAGEFAAAEIPFRRGLDIDPANATANYYYGDILIRRNAPESAAFLRRAVAFGPDTNEAFRAEAALTALSNAEAQRQALVDDLVGEWRIRQSCSYGSGATTMQIAQVDPESGNFSGTIDSCRFEAGSVHGSEIEFSCTRMGTNHISYRGSIRSPTAMGGRYVQSRGQCTWVAAKQ